MKFAGIAAMLAVVTAVTGAPTGQSNSALASLHQLTGDVPGIAAALSPEDKAKAERLQKGLEHLESKLKESDDGEQKREAAGLDIAAGGGIQLRGIDSTLDNITGEATEGVLNLKRDDAISSLSSQLLPKLTEGGILPQGVTDLQLTKLLQVLNVNSLLGDVHPLLNSLLGGLGLDGLLKGLSVDQLLNGLVGNVVGGILKRDGDVTQLAGKLLPSLLDNGILPKTVTQQQLGGLLDILQLHGLLTNLEGALGKILSSGLQGL